MLPLEMVYDYDPIPLSPDYARHELGVDDTGEDNEQEAGEPHVGQDDAALDGDRMSDAEGPSPEAMSDEPRDATRPAEAMSEGEGEPRDERTIRCSKMGSMGSTMLIASGVVWSDCAWTCDGFPVEGPWTGMMRVD